MLGPQSLLGSGLAPARPGLLGVGHRRLLTISKTSDAANKVLNSDSLNLALAWTYFYL
mgnify:CR=1 FL=1